MMHFLVSRGGQVAFLGIGCSVLMYLVKCVVSDVRAGRGWLGDR